MPDEVNRSAYEAPTFKQRRRGLQQCWQCSRRTKNEPNLKDKKRPGMRGRAPMKVPLLKVLHSDRDGSPKFAQRTTRKSSEEEKFFGKDLPLRLWKPTDVGLGHAHLVHRIHHATTWVDESGFKPVSFINTASGTFHQAKERMPKRECARVFYTFPVESLSLKAKDVESEEVILVSWFSNTAHTARPEASMGFHGSRSLPPVSKWRTAYRFLKCNPGTHEKDSALRC